MIGGREKKGSIYYTSWRGFELSFNVASEMSQLEVRKYIGNNKILIYFIDKSTPLQPAFRGSVNSLAIVVQPTEDEKNLKIAFFWKRRILNFVPNLPLSPIPFDNHQLIRDYIFSNAFDGLYAIAKSPPYSNIINNIFATEFLEIQKEIQKK